jgi:hypothetical protein
MDKMKDYIKFVEVNLWVLETAKKTHRDRLGEFISFKMVKHPNESISGVKTLEFIKHLFVLMGYPFGHIRDLGFGEMAEAWVCQDDDSCERIRIVHKYWSGEKCQLCVNLLHELCLFYGIPTMTYYMKEKME